MKNAALLVAAIVALVGVTVDAYVPQVKQSAKPVSKPAFDLKQAAATAFTAATLASNVFLGAPAAQAVDSPFSSSTIVAEKVVREGLYRDYEVDIVQEVDDARSTFKDAKETKSKKGKYTAILGILVVGSFVIPMAQYFWYVRDDDSSDKFFAAQDIPDPEPPKKKGWF
eukprot:CAMPEP_0197434360 /NCGR_PEP_ID=MMETSP1175-20131217/2114_1 /TAXON_ID=1003142 /ORGANISM="Triceratium dubium, Strain CCMP147" /LENGTH=168 /DNA_ID=CAMNT_0042963057 /DNA_START=44 /DNA_END=550 /DNA_ORIENTATION=-